MGKTFWYEDLALVFTGEKAANPFSEIRGAKPNINGDIKDFPCDHINQLPLWMAKLIVKSANRASLGVGKIVLDKNSVYSPLRVFPLMEGFHERPSIVRKHIRLD